MTAYKIEIDTNKIIQLQSSVSKFGTFDTEKYYVVESEHLFMRNEIFNPLGNQATRERRRTQTLKEIEALELKQARPLRELRINPTSEIAINKIITIDNEITALRTEYNALGAE